MRFVAKIMVGLVSLCILGVVLVWFGMIGSLVIWHVRVLWLTHHMWHLITRTWYLITCTFKKTSILV